MLNFCFLNFSVDNVCLNFSSGMLEIAASITKSMAIYYLLLRRRIIAIWQHMMHHITLEWNVPSHLHKYRKLIYWQVYTYITFEIFWLKMLSCWTKGKHWLLQNAVIESWCVVVIVTKIPIFFIFLKIPCLH